MASEEQAAPVAEAVQKSTLHEDGEEPQGAAAAPTPSVPQPPYDEDFNPFSEEGIVQSCVIIAGA